LHLGSLVTAVASYLQARSQNGRWHLRIEDLDPPREMPDAAENILSTLATFGFEWDDEVIWQSRRHVSYAAALRQLDAHQHTYFCDCSRANLREHQAKPGVEGLVYPGTCRTRGLAKAAQTAIRIRTDNTPIRFDDALQGHFCQQLEQDFGDFIIRRADGLFAYQLAVVVDDAFQGVTEVVRGTDLLHSTSRQIYLQTLLGLPPVNYVHLPVVLGADGHKLSKQTGATALDNAQPQHALHQALQFLGQNPPDTLLKMPLPDLWQWAIDHWSLAAIRTNR